jgi:O-antigen ligase
MQSENKTRITSLFNLSVLASFVILVGMLANFQGSISGHFAFMTPEQGGISRYAYFMLALTLISLLILILQQVISRKGGLFIWLPVLYVLFAFVSTVLSGLYPFQRLPFRFVEMFYWVAVMLLSYYSVLSLNTAKFHIAIVALTLPFLSYYFYIMRGTEVSATYVLLNPVYYIAYLMPVVLMLKSKVIKVSGLLLIFVVVVLSYKRLAILAYSTSILVYFYYLSKTGSNTGLWKKITILLGAAMFIAILAYSFQHLTEVYGLDWYGRMADIVEQGGSGRLYIWRTILGDLAAQPDYLLIGHGYESLLITMNMWAHNDFLEILYSFGVIGLTLYLMFVVKIVSIFFEMQRLRYRHLAAFAVSLVWFVFGSMFSILVVRPEWFLGLAMFWGITVADFENAKKQQYFSEIDNEQLDTNENYDENAADDKYDTYAQ